MDHDLEPFTHLQPEQTIPSAAAMLRRHPHPLRGPLVPRDPLVHRGRVVPRNPLILSLSKGERVDAAAGPLFASLPSDPGLALQLFVWPAGVWTPIHDHASWGIYLCLEGELIEDRYVRLDDGAQTGRAHLRHAWRAAWRPGQHSTLLPYAGGIHRVGNPTRQRAISLHLYGPPQSAIDGRDYDPVRDFVCDRAVESTSLLAA